MGVYGHCYALRKCLRANECTWSERTISQKEASARMRKFDRSSAKLYLINLQVLVVVPDCLPPIYLRREALEVLQKKKALQSSRVSFGVHFSVCVQRFLFCSLKLQRFRLEHYSAHKQETI